MKCRNKIERIDERNAEIKWSGNIDEIVRIDKNGALKILGEHRAKLSVLSSVK